MNQYKEFFIQTSTPIPSVHQNLFNLESVVCKTMNSRPIPQLNQQIPLCTIGITGYDICHPSAAKYQDKNQNETQGDACFVTTHSSMYACPL